MPEIDLNKPISDMSLQEAKELRNLLSQDIQKRRKKETLRMEVYISAEFAAFVEAAKDWAFKNRLIKRNTKWTYAKFAIINTTKMILEQRDKEIQQRMIRENTQGGPATYQEGDTENRIASPQ